MAQPPQQSPLQVTLILWGAMLTSHLILAGVGFYLRSVSPPEPMTDLVLPIALTGMGVSVALLSAIGVPLLFKSAPFMTAMLLRYAFAEAATTFGLVLAMLGADMQWFYALVGLGVAAHVAAIPSQSMMDAHEQRRSA